MRISEVPGLRVIFGRPLHRLEKMPGGRRGSASSGSEPCELIVLALPALADGFVDHSQLDEPRSFPTEPPKDTLLREGDVVIQLSPPFSVALARKQDVGILVPSTCAVLRYRDAANPPLHPAYLAAYLALPPVSELMRSKATGATLQVLTSAQIGEIDIPLIDTDRQQKLAELVRAHAEQRRLRREADELESKMVEAAFASVLQEVR